MGVTMPDFEEKSALEIFRMSPVQFQSYFDQLSAATSRILYDGDLEKAAELKAAGWTPEPVYPDSCVYQWRWRRPARKGRKVGRLFLSPEQAISALRYDPKELYKRYAGNTYIRDGKKITVCGIQTSLPVMVLINRRKGQRIPDHITPKDWVEWCGKAREVPRALEPGTSKFCSY